MSRRKKWLGLGVMAAVLILLVDKGCESWLRRDAIRVALYWSRLEPIPRSARSLQVETDGSMFTRGFFLTFQLPPEDLQNWLQISPGIKDATATEHNGETCYQIRPKEAEFAQLCVDFATGRVRLRTYLS